MIHTDIKIVTCTMKFWWLMNRRA